MKQKPTFVRGAGYKYVQYKYQVRTVQTVRDTELGVPALCHAFSVVRTAACAARSC